MAWRAIHITASTAMVASAGWYIAIVELIPESWRPYIDGSTGNSLLELTLGYNGVGRLNGGDYGGLGNAGFCPGCKIMPVQVGTDSGAYGYGA